MHLNCLGPQKFNMRAQEHGHLCSKKFAMNKALEQKLIGPMEESHTKEQSPKQFCERYFEQGDRKSQQNELELVLELDGDFLARRWSVWVQE